MEVYAYERLTAQEIQNIAENEHAIAVLDIGSIEQHGYHLPVGTDYIIGQAFLDEAVKRLDSENVTYLLLPQLPFSCSIEHQNVPGTITFTPIMVIQMIEAVGESLLRAGLKNLVIMSGHGGNEHEMEIAARELHIKGMNTFCIHNFLAQGKYGAEESDVHAGALETSVMLEIAPDTVHMDKITKEASDSVEIWDSMTDHFSCASQAWIATDLSKEGVCGKPILGKAKQGKYWLNTMGSEIAKAFKTIEKQLF